MVNWLEDMIARPPSYPMPDWEYQIRRNALIPEAEMIRDSMAKPRPSVDNVNSNAQKQAHKKLVHKWEDENDVNFLRTMDMLWDGKYGGK